MEWDQEKAYSWEIEKSATPESIELKEGEDGTFTYTLLATRTVKETNIATLTGLATVTNTGNVDLTNIAVEIILKDADGVEIDKYTTTIAALAVGLQEGLPYSFTFDPTGYKAPFKVIAKATDGASDEVETEQLLPTPKVTEIDKDAYVKDTFDAFGVTGIAIEGNIDRDWLDIIEGTDWNSLTSSWSVSYTVVATNTGAAPGEYPLDNTVVIYGEDTNKDYDSDNETVKIYVPAVGLNIELETEVSWTKETEYDWEIEKSVSPTSVVLDKEESADIDYTVVVTKNKVSETYTYTISGTVTIKNTGETTLNNITGKVYYAGKEELFGWASISAGGSQTETFSFEVVSSTPIASFTVKAEATSDETSAPDESSTPSIGSAESDVSYDDEADVDDEITGIPAGFSWNSLDYPFAFTTDESTTVTYTITLTNELVGYGNIVEGPLEMKLKHPATNEAAYFGFEVKINGITDFFNGWCVDLDHQISTNQWLNGYLISSYSKDAWTYVDKPENIDMLNYIINHYSGGQDSYKWEDIQKAIWYFIDDNPESLTTKAQQIVADALANGAGFVPSCGDVIAAIIVPDGSRQVTIIEVPMPCDPIKLVNTATVYRKGTKFVFDYSTAEVTIELVEHLKTIEPGDFRTQTMGGWGTAAAGNNPGAYRDANFASAFPNGLLVGSSSGYSALFNSSLAIQNFLPAGGPSASFDKNYTNPSSTNAGTLAGQAVALTLSIEFDLYDSNFGASSYNLKDLLVGSGDFLGWTVEQVLAEANRFLAGLGSTYSATQLNDVLNSINENFVDGNTNKGFLRLP